MMDEKLRHEIIEALESYCVFAEEILPQAGQLCFDLGNLNAGLLLTSQILAKIKEK